MRAELASARRTIVDQRRQLDATQEPKVQTTRRKTNE